MLCHTSFFLRLSSTRSIQLNTQDIKNEFVRLYLNENFNQEGLIEITGASFEADAPYIITPGNEDYQQAEVDWYRSMSLNVNDLFTIYGKPVKIWEQVSSKNGYINSNYGHLVFSARNGYQYTNVMKELIKNPYSRRAVMIYQRPTMHKDYCKRGMNDFVCTNVVQYFIKYGHLFAIVQMRSNDAIFGYNNDYIWQRLILEELATDLDLIPGKITWQVGSLHIYPRHFKLLEIKDGNNND